MYKQLIIAFLLTTTAFSQNGWYYQSSNIISDIYFVNDFIGYAAGVGHSIYKTEDGGETWFGLTTGLGYSEEIAAISGGRLYFTDNQLGWYVGQQNTLLKTTNGGTSWEKLNSGLTLSTNQYVHFKNAFFWDNNFGWVVGYSGFTTGGNIQGVILKTTDGGNTWSSQLLGTFLTSVTFTTQQKGWIVGAQGSIFITLDGGTTWNNQTSGTSNLLYDIAFKNENDGITVGIGTVLTTSDGGVNWVKKEVSSSTLYSVSYLSSGTAFIAGGGKLYKSNDNGTNWSIQNDSIPFGVDRLFFNSSLKGWYSASQGEGIGIAKTTDGGVTWIKKTYTRNIEKLFILKNPLRIWGMQWQGVVHSPDGQKWKFMENSLIKNMQDIWFKDVNNGWIVGGYNFQNNMLRTTDGGNSWGLQNNNVVQNFNSIFFVDTTFGWAAGTNGTVIQTLDGGQTWGLQSTPTVAHLYGIAFANREVGYAVGRGTYGAHIGKNVVLKTYNSGLLWNVIYIDSLKSQLKKIICFDENTILITYGDKLSRSVDGGISWSTIFNRSNYGIYDVSFSDQSHGWVSTGVDLFKTIDGGASWTQNILAPTSSFEPINFLDANHGWVVSGGYGILYTSNGGITSVEKIQPVKEIPQNFVLHQNYPNPFNPTTTIKYSVPKVSTVSLKIFDILGSEVRELVHEEKAAGEYEINFNAAGLSSGLYFYQLISGSIISTKKMLLVK